LQVLLEGAERQDYCTHYPEGSAEEDRLAEQDVAFWPPQPAVQSVVLAPMDYTLYYPRELHAPNLAVDRPGPTRKAVVKVSAELF
ncbi:MAG: YhcH/YjgK/YiaL family protein, partial [Desulfovibrio sp.]|nr:YhcH/YjgK/YiaL family protein [Desulfovibrio sp.]